jgi:hypothetical protein
LKENRRATDERLIVAFHKWLLKSDKAVATVTGVDLQRFAEGPRRPVGQMTRNDYRYRVRLYLRWLEERGLAGPFAPQELQGYHRRPLSEAVRRYLRSLAPTRRPATVRAYLQTLRLFHEWLDPRAVAVDDVGRPTCLAWAERRTGGRKQLKTRRRLRI